MLFQFFLSCLQTRNLITIFLSLSFQPQTFLLQIIISFLINSFDLRHQLQLKLLLKFRDNPQLHFTQLVRNLFQFILTIFQQFAAPKFCFKSDLLNFSEQIFNRISQQPTLCLIQINRLNGLQLFFLQIFKTDVLSTFVPIYNHLLDHLVKHLIKFLNKSLLLLRQPQKQLSH